MDNKREKLSDLTFKASQIEVGVRSGLDHMRKVMDQGHLLYQDRVDGLPHRALKKQKKEAVIFLKQELKQGALNEVFAQDAREALDFYRIYGRPLPISIIYCLVELAKGNIKF